MEIPELHRVVGAVQPELQLLRLASSTAGVTLSPCTALGILNTCWKEKQPLGSWLFLTGKADDLGIV